MTPKEPKTRLSTGIAQLDDLLGGQGLDQERGQPSVFVSQRPKLTLLQMVEQLYRNRESR